MSAKRRSIVACSLFLVCTVLELWGQRTSRQRKEWNQPFAPFHIAGNLYYVGARGVSAFLITTPKGDVLLDGGLEETASQVEKNVVKLGFRMADVRYLLNSHAHYDHCGGLAELQRASGAAMVVSRPDAATLSSGHQLSYGKGQSESNFPAVKVSRVVNDGGTVSLGGTTLTAHITPGHTKGCTTWSMPVAENGKTYQVVFYCSTTVAGNQLIGNPKYPGIVADYRHSFAVLKNLRADIFLAPHPEFFDMEKKVAQKKLGGPNPFVDPAEMSAFVAQSEKDFNEELQHQKTHSTD